MILVAIIQQHSISAEDILSLPKIKKSKLKKLWSPWTSAPSLPSTRYRIVLLVTGLSTLNSLKPSHPKKENLDTMSSLRWVCTFYPLSQQSGDHDRTGCEECIYL